MAPPRIVYITPNHGTKTPESLTHRVQPLAIPPILSHLGVMPDSNTPSDRTPVRGTTLDLTELLRDGKHFAEKRAGVTHIIDSETGKTIMAFSGGTREPQLLVPAGDGSDLLVTPGLNVNALLEHMVPYSPLLLDLVCQKLAEGENLTQICKTPGFPTYRALCAWRRKYPEVSVALNEAKRDRAEALRDKALNEAEGAVSRDPVTASALRVDTYKWASGIDDPRYSPKAKVEATLNAPTQIVIHTGINREEPNVRQVHEQSTTSDESE